MNGAGVNVSCPVELPDTTVMAGCTENKLWFITDTEKNKPAVLVEVCEATTEVAQSVRTKIPLFSWTVMGVVSVVAGVKDGGEGCS
jgi:hypothetical protein